MIGKDDRVRQKKILISKRYLQLIDDSYGFIYLRIGQMTFQCDLLSLGPHIIHIMLLSMWFHFTTLSRLNPHPSPCHLLHSTTRRPMTLIFICCRLPYNLLIASHVFIVILWIDQGDQYSSQIHTIQCFRYTMTTY